MIKAVGRLADRLVSKVLPEVTASAALQTQCQRCSTYRARLCRRDCINGVCEPWGCGTCGSC